jgi:hypothetical protein
MSERAARNRDQRSPSKLFTAGRNIIIIVFVQGGSPTPHPLSSRPHFVCKFIRQRSTNKNCHQYFESRSGSALHKKLLNTSNGVLYICSRYILGPKLSTRNNFFLRQKDVNLKMIRYVERTVWIQIGICRQKN